MADLDLGGGTRLSTLVDGVPGRSPSNGPLGMCTVALVRTPSAVVVVDPGQFGARALVVERLLAEGVEPGDVTDVVVTHAHYDHVDNLDLFPAARLHLGRTEVEWATRLDLGDPLVPVRALRGLLDEGRVVLADDDTELVAGVRTIATPGHTPGHRAVVVEGADIGALVVGDLLKNRAEVASRRSLSAVDQHASAASVQTVLDLWQSAPGCVLVPGHDEPLRWDGHRPVRTGGTDMVLELWPGDDLEPITLSSDRDAEALVR
jgi:N-acyl homoserine lactone hydrolase